MVSVCIVNWNGRDYLTKCLNSVYQQDYQGGIEIIIVDNHSTDGSLECIKASPNGIKLIENEINKGFCYAHNQAIKASKGEYILPLNFDVFLEPNFISEMVKLMEKDPGVGIISGKLYKQASGIKSRIIDSTGITMEHCFMRPRGALEEDLGQYDRPDSLMVFGACGAAPFYRRTMLEDTRCFNEFFDHDFVNYVEDVDLSWRAQQRGWQCLYNPAAIAYHERGITRKNNPQIQKEYLIYGFRNRYCSMIKNIGSGYWKKNRFKIIGRELIFLIISPAAISRVLRLKVLFLTLKMFKKMLSKRKIIQSRSFVPDDYMDNFFCYNGLNLSKKGCEMLLMTLRGVISKLRIKKLH
ncbi:glycosyltransferase family 2 protein [Candidatus Omnitrophota bacterium]